MYCAVLTHNSIDNTDIDIIAVHDDMEVVERYIDQNKDKNLSIIKIKKKAINKINYLYEDKYLVRLGDQYIPYEYYEAAKCLSNEAVYDLEYCKDILLRILEESNLTEKECKAVSKTISVINDEIRTMEIDVIDTKMLKEINSLNKDFKERIGLNNE